MNCESVKISTISHENEIYDVLCVLSKDLFNQSINNPCTLQYLAKKYAQNATAFVAYVNEEPKGLCVFYDNDKVAKIAFLTMIVVEKEEQGKGIGRELIKNMISHCIFNGMEELKLEVANANWSAIQFYNKHGFVVEKKSKDTSIYKYLLQKNKTLV